MTGVTIFIILGVITLGGGLAAMRLRNLVHCALWLAVSLAGLAGIYLQLDAQFIGLAQVLVYVGAVAVLILFSVLLTRGFEPEFQPVFASGWVVGAGVAALVFGVLCWMFLAGGSFAGARQAMNAGSPVRGIGTQLMGEYILPLQVIGLLLTAALIGAAIIAMRREGDK